MPEIKRCPFCGGVELIEKWNKREPDSELTKRAIDWWAAHGQLVLPRHKTQEE